MSNPKPEFCKIGVKDCVCVFAEKKENPGHTFYRYSSDFGTPEGTRTPSPQNRNLMRYPIALRAHIAAESSAVSRVPCRCRALRQEVLYQHFPDL